MSHPATVEPSKAENLEETSAAVAASAAVQVAAVRVAAVRVAAVAMSAPSVPVDALELLWIPGFPWWQEVMQSRQSPRRGHRLVPAVYQ